MNGTAPQRLEKYAQRMLAIRRIVEQILLDSAERDYLDTGYALECFERINLLTKGA